MVVMRQFGNNFHMKIEDFKRILGARGTFIVNTHDYEHIDIVPCEAICTLMHGVTNYVIAWNAWWNRLYHFLSTSENVVILPDKGRVNRIVEILNGCNEDANVIIWKYRSDRKKGIVHILRKLDDHIPVLGIRITSATMPPKNHFNASRLEIMTELRGHTFEVTTVDLDKTAIISSNDGSVPGLY